MPRKPNGEERPVGLTESPKQSENTNSAEDIGSKFVLVPKAEGEDTIGSARSLRSLHPYTRPLTVSDLDSCVALENAAFENPQERCSPEKVSPFRLSRACPGLFCVMSCVPRTFAGPFDVIPSVMAMHPLFTKICYCARAVFAKVCT